MGIFGKKDEIGADIGKPWHTEQEIVVDFDSVLAYLVGLSGDDYTRICQVAEVYREADHKSREILGLRNVVTAFIDPPEQPNEDDIASSFLDDDNYSASAAKHRKLAAPGTKIKVNNK